MTLTPREQQIADGIAAGLSYKEIGKLLVTERCPYGISGGVVRNYARRIVEKEQRMRPELGTRTAITVWLLECRQKAS